MFQSITAPYLTTDGSIPSMCSLIYPTLLTPAHKLGWMQCQHKGGGLQHENSNIKKER